MKFFSKLLLVIGILLFCLGLAMGLTGDTAVESYYEYEDRLIDDEGRSELTDSEMEDRYEEYLAGEADDFSSAVWTIIILGIGFAAAAFGIVHLDKVFLRNKINVEKEYEHNRDRMDY